MKKEEDDRDYASSRVPLPLRESRVGRGCNERVGLCSVDKFNKLSDNISW